MWDQYRRSAIRRALAALPEDQAKALRLAFFQDLSHEEVAQFLAVPLGTAKGRIRLALGKPERASGGAGGDPGGRRLGSPPGFGCSAGPGSAGTSGPWPCSPAAAWRPCAWSPCGGLLAGVTTFAVCFRRDLRAAE